MSSAVAIYTVSERERESFGARYLHGFARRKYDTTFFGLTGARYTRGKIGRDKGNFAFKKIFNEMH